MQKINNGDSGLEVANKIYNNDLQAVLQWKAEEYPIDTLVFYNKNFYKNNAIATAGEVPGVSSKWVAQNIGSLDVINLVLKDFIVPPTETVWVEIPPNPSETDNAILNINFVEETGYFGYAHGSLSIADIESEYTLIKVVGDFTTYGGIMWLAGIKDPTTYTKLLTGIKPNNEYEFTINRALHDTYLYTRLKGNHRFYKGKVVQPAPTENSVKNAINTGGGGGTGGSNSAIIDAYSKWGVSPTKTGAENSVAMNNAILDAYTNKKRLVLPGGIIPHNGFNYKEGVDIEGAGISNTVLLSKSSVTAFKDLDLNNENKFNCGSITNLTLDGDNIGSMGFELHNNQGFFIANAIIKKFSKAGKFVGMLAHSMHHVVVATCADGIDVLTSDNSFYGYMQANLIHYTDVYSAQIDGAVFRIDRGSNISFTSCNFESCGTIGDITTGAVIAKRLSPFNEGIDLSFYNCWTEGLRSVFLNISESNGNTSIRDTMIHKGGNGAGSNVGPAIINDASKVLLTGSTKLTGFNNGIVTQNNGRTLADGFATDFLHTEQTGGTFKSAQYL